MQRLRGSAGGEVVVPCLTAELHELQVPECVTAQELHAALTLAATATATASSCVSVHATTTTTKYHDGDSGEVDNSAAVATAAAATAADVPTLVVDVRDASEFVACHIAGSVNVPYSEACAEEVLRRVLAREAASPSAAQQLRVVFVSMCSPDVDDVAAREFALLYEAATHRAVRASCVCVLLGGLHVWRQHYPCVTTTPTAGADNKTTLTSMCGAGTAAIVST